METTTQLQHRYDDWESQNPVWARRLTGPDAAAALGYTGEREAEFGSRREMMHARRTAQRAAAMKASFAYYGGEFGERLARATASLLALLDVQQTTMAFNAFISLRCDGYKGYDDTFLREEPDTARRGVGRIRPAAAAA